jgi:hypothetical protein
MRLVTFNMFVGNSNPRRAIREVIADTRDPEVLCLQEARFVGQVFGYERISADDLSVLVREDLKIRHKRLLEVDGPSWRGPHLGIKHPARRFPGVTFETENEVWDVLDVHRTPSRQINEESWEAEHHALRRWANRRHNRVVMAGDWNGRVDDPRPLSVGDLATETNGHTFMRGIDGAIVRKGRATSRKLQSQYGSDAHRPVVIDIEEI